MRIRTAAFVLFGAGVVASAQAATAQRVRVLGNTMARQLVTRVEPVYPAAALEKGVSGEVTLYTAVGKDGAVEEVAVVNGPVALQSAAIDAVKQWKYKPWLVNGAPVEVDTTVILDFVPGRMSGGARQDAKNVAMFAPPATHVHTGTNQSGTMPAGTTLNATGAGAVPTRSAPASAMLGQGRSNGIDWETDRRAGEMPIRTAPAAVAPGGNQYGSVRPSPGMQSASSMMRPAIGAAGFGGTSLPAASAGVVIGNDGRTEWRLLKKVAPEYPQEAVDAGIEGVVMVAGVVKTDGMLRDLHAVSGPAELHQAAVDAAAQYVFEPVMHGDQLGEARTQVPVVFTLSGPAKVAPEVMAGRVLNSFTPPYPPEAIKQGVQGAVVLHVLIGRQGQVKDVRVVSGREVLRATAVDAVKEWKYEPYKRNGVDVEVETDVTVQFSLLPR